MRIRRAGVVLVCLISCVSGAVAQVGIDAGAALGGGSTQATANGGTAKAVDGGAQAAMAMQGNVVLASTTADYPVTPGDTFSLTFLQSTQAAMMRLFVNPDGSINAGIFGRIEARGMTYPALKATIEKLVAKGYPGSNPSLQFVATGIFTVLVEGEVKVAEQQTAWGLTRLSELVKASATRYADRRSVLVRRAEGSERRFDLFKAEREGDLSENPYVRPGDTIVLGRAERTVTITGSVYRPGSYQLLPGEELKEAIAYYAGGFTGKANQNRLNLTRDPESGQRLGETAQIDYAKDPGFVLRDFDAILVPPVSELLPVVYFEGAIGVQAAAGAADKPLDAANKISHVFVPGETLSQAAQSLRNDFTATSDLEHAYILRDKAKIPVNLADLIYKSDFTQDQALVPNETIIIPFRQFFVTVAGAVMAPGRYPYVPDRSYQYYMNLAGGYDPNRSTGKSFSINNVMGAKKDPAKDLEPEDRLFVNEDSFIYNFGKVLAIVGNLATVISASYTVYSLIPKH